MEISERKNYTTNQSIMNIISTKTDILDTAANAIYTWNQVRNNQASVIKYFDGGCAFTISREDYESWATLWANLNKSSDFLIHGYMGLGLIADSADFSLSLYNVDSHTDKLDPSLHRAEYSSYLKHSPYISSITGTIRIGLGEENQAIGVTEALQRSTNWRLFKNNWLASQTDLVQLFKIPFSDLDSLFQDVEVSNLVLIPALAPNKDNQFDIDLVIWGQRGEEGIVWQDLPEDFLRPCPPYCSDRSEFRLLHFALDS